MTDLGALVATRIALHSVAEHVLAAALHQWNGRIGLRATPGGFGTPEVDVDGVVHRVRVDGTDLVVEEDGVPRVAPLTTLGAAAAHVGIPLGGPADVYELVTSAATPEAPLALDPGATAMLAEWFALGTAALGAFAAEVAPEGPPAAQLWPEHFDVATVHDEVNYGASPGDEAHPEPYLYVGPWGVPSPDGFWNEPWGRSWPRSEVPDVATAVRALRTGMSAARPR